jgi:hypothetical protein
VPALGGNVEPERAAGGAERQPVGNSPALQISAASHDCDGERAELGNGEGRHLTAPGAGHLPVVVVVRVQGSVRGVDGRFEAREPRRAHKANERGKQRVFNEILRAVLMKKAEKGRPHGG